MKKSSELTEVELAERDGGLWKPVFVEVPDINDVTIHQSGEPLKARFIRCYKEIRWQRIIEDDPLPDPKAGLPLKSEVR